MPASPWSPSVRDTTTCTARAPSFVTGYGKQEGEQQHCFYVLIPPLPHTSPTPLYPTPRRRGQGCWRWKPRACVWALYSHVELGERGGICRCFYGGAGLHPGGICFAPRTSPARGACRRGNGFEFQANLQMKEEEEEGGGMRTVWEGFFVCFMCEMQREMKIYILTQHQKQGMKELLFFLFFSLFVCLFLCFFFINMHYIQKNNSIKHIKSSVCFVIKLTLQIIIFFLFKNYIIGLNV